MISIMVKSSLPTAVEISAATVGATNSWEYNSYNPGDTMRGSNFYQQGQSSGYRNCLVQGSGDTDRYIYIYVITILMGLYGAVKPINIKLLGAKRNVGRSSTRRATDNPRPNAYLDTAQVFASCVACVEICSPTKVMSTW